MEFFLIALAYLIGSIPFGLVFGKCLGVDVRSGGSGNIGATNVNRLLGKKMGILTLFADISKAIIAMLIVEFILANHHDKELWIVVAGGAAFLGHLYPAYLNFKGGKGVATALGVFLYLAPIVLLPVAAAFGITEKKKKKKKKKKIVTSALLPISLWLFHFSQLHIWLALFIAALIWFKHRGNISRLLRHEESHIKSK